MDLIPGPLPLFAKLDEPVDGHLNRFLMGMLAQFSLPMDESFKGVKDSQQLHVRNPGEQASAVNSFFGGPKRCLHSTVRVAVPTRYGFRYGRFGVEQRRHWNQDGDHPTTYSFLLGSKGSIRSSRQKLRMLWITSRLVSPTMAIYQLRSLLLSSMYLQSIATASNDGVLLLSQFPNVSRMSWHKPRTSLTRLWRT